MGSEEIICDASELWMCMCVAHSVLQKNLPPKKLHAQSTCLWSLCVPLSFPSWQKLFIFIMTRLSCGLLCVMCMAGRELFRMMMVYWLGVCCVWSFFTHTLAETLMLMHFSCASLQCVYIYSTKKCVWKVIEQAMCEWVNHTWKNIERINSRCPPILSPRLSFFTLSSRILTNCSVETVLLNTGHTAAQTSSHFRTFTLLPFFPTAWREGKRVDPLFKSKEDTKRRQGVICRSDAEGEAKEKFAPELVQ